MENPQNVIYLKKIVESLSAIYNGLADRNLWNRQTQNDLLLLLVKKILK